MKTGDKNSRAPIPIDARIPMTQGKLSQTHFVVKGKRSLLSSHLLIPYSSMGLASYPAGATDAGKQFRVILKGCSVREEYSLLFWFDPRQCSTVEREELMELARPRLPVTLG